MELIILRLFSKELRQVEPVPYAHSYPISLRNSRDLPVLPEVVVKALSAVLIQLYPPTNVHQELNDRFANVSVTLHLYRMTHNDIMSP